MGTIDLICRLLLGPPLSDQRKHRRQCHHHRTQPPPEPSPAAPRIHYTPPASFTPLPPHDAMRPSQFNASIHNGQHLEILNLFTRIARYELIVVCPWIRGHAGNDFARRIPELHKRGVRVRVLFGWQPVEKTGYYDESDEELVDLYRQLLGRDMVRVRAGTHSKLLIVDRRGAAITSWNWLSHRYRGGGGERAEDGVYTTAIQTVDRLLENLRIQGRAKE